MAASKTKTREAGVTRTDAETFSRDSDAQSFRRLVDTGLALIGERDMNGIARVTLEAGRDLSHAHFGALFYTPHADTGETRQRCHFTSAAGGTLAGQSMAPALFSPAKFGIERLRTGDVLHHPAFAGQSPFSSTPFGNRAISSYMHVPLCVTHTGQVGGMLYGHPEPDRFSAAHEQQMMTLAAQACAAIEAAQLTASFAKQAADARAALRAQELLVERLRQALDAGQMGTWMWKQDSDLMDLDERAAWLFDEPVAHKPVLRSNLQDRMVREHTLSRDDMHQAAANGGVYDTEYRIRLHDGKQRWLRSRGTVTKDDGGKVTGMTGTLEDITRRKSQEAALLQREKLAASGRLAARIAHEINNPLEAVTNLIFLAKTEPGISSPVQHMLETADHELSRVTQLAQHTLGFFHSATEQTAINLTELLEGVTPMLSGRVERNGSASELDYKPDYRPDCRLDLERGLFVWGTEGELRQILSNVLANAVEASPGKPIVIRAHSVTQHGRPGVSVMVADRGAGIAASARQRIFTPFFTTKPMAAGGGMGLWIARGIVEKLGGSIGFRTSTASPTGTVVRVFLPAAALHADHFSTARSDLIQ